MKSLEALRYYSELSTSFNSIPVKGKYTYQIEDNAFFEKTYADSPVELQKVYWMEILQRAHWAAFSSLLRNLKWTEGVTNAVDGNNFLSFTANLRCLIESCGDTLLSLKTVAMTLADNHDKITKVLEGNSNDNTILVSKALEEILIHFSYARKITEEEKNAVGTIPKYQNAKPASEYLKHLDNKLDNGPIGALYSFLCQFSHPAAHSTHFFFKEEQEAQHYKFSYLDNPDENNIKLILSKYESEIIKSLMLGFNPSLLVLKTLNLFGYPEVQTPNIDSINLEELKTWRYISDKFI